MTNSQALDRQVAIYRAPSTYRRVLVPLDGSPQAEAVLPHARMMARRFNAKLELVRAYARSPVLVAATVASSMPGTGPLLDTAPYMEAGREEAVTYLERVQAKLRREGLDVEHRRLEGPTGESIVGEADRWDADMIAMTTHGRGGFDRLVHGSVASYVCHHANCPVFLVRPDTDPPR